MKHTDKQGIGAEIPDMPDENIDRGSSPTVGTFGIDAATVPNTMTRAMVGARRLSLRTMRCGPLRREVPLCNGQRTGEPEGNTAARQRANEPRSMPYTPHS